MTSPVEEIDVECPRCATVYRDWYRGSINLDLDDFDSEYVLQATTATCPDCHFVVELDSLVIDGDVWRFMVRAEPRPRVVAECGTAVVVTLDGRDAEDAPSVVYERVHRRIGHIAMAGSHLRFFHGYSAPFTGTADERVRIELDVARLVADS